MTLSFLSACSDIEFNMDTLASVYETKNDEKDNEISILKEELRLIKDELEQEKKNQEKISVELQIFDHQARRIMRLIAEKEFNKLRNEHNVDFEVIDERIVFNKISDYSLAPALPIEISRLPMYFAYYNPQPEFTEVGYFLYDIDRKYDINFHLGEDSKFIYVTMN